MSILEKYLRPVAKQTTHAVNQQWPQFSLANDAPHFVNTLQEQNSKLLSDYFSLSNVGSSFSYLKIFPI